MQPQRSTSRYYIIRLIGGISAGLAGACIAFAAILIVNGRWEGNLVMILGILLWAVTFYLLLILHK